MVQTHEIVAFVRKKAFAKHASANSDLYEDLGLAGDDFHDLIKQFAGKYKVDMSAYLWYFHADEEGMNMGGLFFKPPYARVKRIPVTPEMLAAFANSGSWSIDYPPHHLPRMRYDMLFNRFIAAILLLVFAILLYFKYSS